MMVLAIGAPRTAPVLPIKTSSLESRAEERKLKEAIRA